MTSVRASGIPSLSGAVRSGEAALAFVSAILAFTLAPRVSAAAGAPISALASRGDVVVAGTEERGLLVSGDGGATFSKVATVACPGDSVRDVLLAADGGLDAACGDLRTAWHGAVGGSFTRDDSGAELFGDVCARFDFPGGPLLGRDPLAGERSRVTALFTCGFIGCDAARTVSGTAIEAFVGCPLAAPQLLAAAPKGSPFLLWAVPAAGGTAVRRSLSRARPFTMTKGDGGWFPTLNLDPVGRIPDGGIVALGREEARPERVLAGGSQGLWISTDEGATWSRLEGVPGPVAALAVDPTAPGRYAAATGTSVLESADGGATWSVALTAGARVTALTFDALDPSRVVCGLEDGTLSSTRVLHALAGPAGRPTILSVERSGEALVVRWVARSVEPTRFRVERRSLGSASFTDLGGLLSGSSFTDAGPPKDTPLAYRVVAVGEQGVEATSDEAFGIVPTTEPLPPDGLQASTSSDGSFLLSWNDRSGREEGYRIEFRGTSAALRDYEWRRFAVTGPDVTSFRVPPSSTGLTQGLYRVRAFNGAGESAASATAGHERSLGTVTLSGSQTTAGGVRTVVLNVLASPEPSEATVERSLGGAPFVAIGPVSLVLESGFFSQGVFSVRRTGSYSDVGVPADVDAGYRLRISDDVSGAAGAVYSNTVVLSGEDFGLTLPSGSLSSSWQDSPELSVAVTSASGSTGPVALTAEASDPAVIPSLRPASVAPGQPAVLSLSFSPSIPPGPYRVVVRGTRGTAVHEAALDVTVTEAVYLVTAASAPGAAGAFFRTDVLVVSGAHDDRGVTFTPTFLDRAPGGTDVVGETRHLGWLGSAFFADYLVSGFGAVPPAFGPVRFDADAPLAVTALVATDNACGAVGFAFAGVRERDALASGFFPMVSLAPPDGGPKRTNLIFLNPSHARTATVHVWSSQAGMDVVLPPLGWVQLNDVRTDLSSPPPAQPLPYSSDQPVLALATVIDNVSNQAFAVAPLPRP